MTTKPTKVRATPTPERQTIMDNARRVSKIVGLMQGLDNASLQQVAEFAEKFKATNLPTGQN